MEDKENLMHEIIIVVLIIEADILFNLNIPSPRRGFKSAEYANCIQIKNCKNKIQPSEVQLMFIALLN